MLAPLSHVIIICGTLWLSGMEWNVECLLRQLVTTRSRLCPQNNGSESKSLTINTSDPSRNYSVCADAQPGQLASVSLIGTHTSARSPRALSKQRTSTMIGLDTSSPRSHVKADQNAGRSQQGWHRKNKIIEVQPQLKTQGSRLVDLRNSGFCGRNTHEGS